MIKKNGAFHEMSKVVNSLFGEARYIAEFGVANCQLGFESSRNSGKKNGTTAATYRKRVFCDDSAANASYQKPIVDSLPLCTGRFFTGILRIPRFAPA